MNFNSFDFLLFYAVVFSAFYAIPSRMRWILLLIASYYFYAQWNLSYLILILYATICAYFAGLLLSVCGARFRKTILSIAICLLLVPLLVFKYGDFIAVSVISGLDLVGVSYSFSVIDFLLPVGISFFSFQAIAYVVDVYRKPSVLERHLGFFALYISFFPQLVAGPIERAEHILPQLRAFKIFNSSRATSGFRLALWGMFKKMVIADRIAALIDPIFADPHAFDGVRFSFAAVAFGVQIYCDFSAYSDIAIGVSRVLGISLMRNFRNPYLAVSLRDFWQRWHISLSTWFRDYLYVPLGGSRVRGYRWVRNILIVFVISGLWHGAAWTFAIWGGLHGAGLVIERAIGKSYCRLFRRPMHSFVSSVFTFSFVSFLWIFFRAGSFSDAWYMITNLHTGWRWRLLYALDNFAPWSFLGLDAFQLKLIGIFVTVLVAVEWVLWPSKKIRSLNVPRWLRWCVYLLIVEIILLFGVYSNDNSFIYFQF